MRLNDIRHQERAVSVLRRALRSGRMPHAYLFEGPEGVGKELAARALAARLLCEADGLAADADACGQCNSCHMLASENHPDFHLIDRGLRKFHPDRTIRASKGLFLVVDLIRHFVIEPAGIKPTQGRRRVFVIRDAERMNEEAQNALLKTLEEPPGTACLILVTSAASRLLPTILSRCQRVPFGLLPAEFVAGELHTRAKVPVADAQALAGLTGGRLGTALLWQRLGLLEVADAVAQVVGALPGGNVEGFGKAVVELATELALRARGQADEEEAADSDEDEEAERPKSGGKTVPTDELRDALKLVFMLVAALYREALVTRAGAPALNMLPRQAAVTKQLAAGNSLDRLQDDIAAVSDAERMLDRNVAPQLVCERLGVALLGEVALGV